MFIFIIFFVYIYCYRIFTTYIFGCPHIVSFWPCWKTPCLLEVCLCHLIFSTLSFPPYIFHPFLTTLSLPPIFHHHIFVTFILSLSFAPYLSLRPEKDGMILLIILVCMEMRDIGGRRDYSAVVTNIYIHQTLITYISAPGWIKHIPLQSLVKTHTYQSFFQQPVVLVSTFGTSQSPSQIQLRIRIQECE